VFGLGLEGVVVFLKLLKVESILVRTRMIHFSDDLDYRKEYLVDGTLIDISNG